jgi:hypothetical protein
MSIRIGNYNKISMIPVRHTPPVSSVVQRILVKIKEINDLKKEHPSPRAAKIKQKIQENDDKIEELFKHIPIRYTEELFIELTKENENNDKYLVEPALACRLLLTKHTYISAQKIQIAYPNIVPNYNVHNLKFEAPISNPLLYEILKNKDIFSKLSYHQIKNTFESSISSKSPYDEQFDFACLMIDTDFDKIFTYCCSMTYVILSLFKLLEKIENKEVPNGKINQAKRVLDKIINKLKEEKYSSMLKEIISKLRTKMNLIIYRETVTFLLDRLIEENKWKSWSDIELQKEFDILLNLANKPQIPFQRNTEKNDECYEIALKIYQIYESRLTPQQKQLAFLKSIEPIPHRGIRFPILASEIIRCSPGVLKNNASLIEKALRNSTYFHTNGKLFNKNLAQEVLNAVKNNNIRINYYTLENIYQRITNKLSIPGQMKSINPELLYFSQDIYNIMYKLDPTKSEKLVVYV